MYGHEKAWGSRPAIAQLSVSFVSILEGGQSSNNPTPAILGRLARALGVTLAKLTESEPP